MKIFKKFFILLSALIFCSFVYADSPNETLTQQLNNIRSMQADFTQTIVNKTGKTIVQSEGKMSLARPGKFRWDVKKPVAQLLVANGSRLWIYDPDLEQVTIRSLVKAAGEAPALLLSDANTTLAKDFYVKQEATSSLEWFLLTPKNSDSVFARIKLAFANNQIREMDLEDQLGHKTQIQFRNIVLNQPLSSSLFAFPPPANVDVIDETGKTRKTKQKRL